MVDVIERIEVMLKQEDSSYKTYDYLAHQQKLTSCDGSFCASSSSENSSHSSGGINESWREKICEWSYQVIDHFDFSREVVMVAMNFLDRYLASRAVNKKVFQLAAMTALFLAIKLNEPGKLTMASMIELSRGYFTVDQMVAMEISILRSLKWMVHPPTAFCLTRYLLHLLPFHSISMDARHDTLELSRFLTELGVMDYFFVLHRPSTIALAAILNALEEIPSVPHQTQSVLLSQIQHNTSLDVFSTDIDECRARLRLHYIQGGYARPSSTVQTNRNSAISPVSVTYGLNGYRQYVYTKTNEASEHHVY